MNPTGDGGQESIRSTRLGRTAALAGAGARVGMNYLRHYARRALGNEKNEERLHAENAADVYETFSKLKGGPLKLAQMLSIDQNMLPPAYVREFAQAQYSAPPLSYPLVVRTFRREFGKEPREIFDAFEPKAAAGASIGQVHRATKGEQAFAVKVQYPGVRESLRNDLRVVKPIALAVLGLREADVAEFFAEVEARLLEETDYALEQRRSIQLAAACAGLPGVRFPAAASGAVLGPDPHDGLGGRRAARPLRRRPRQPGGNATGSGKRCGTSTRSKCRSCTSFTPTRTPGISSSATACCGCSTSAA